MSTFVELYDNNYYMITTKIEKTIKKQPIFKMYLKILIY